MRTALFTSSEIESAWRANTLPGWVALAYEEFRAKVEDETFPCTFGIVAHRKGDLLYAYAEAEPQNEAGEQLRESAAAFVQKARAMPVVNAAMSALTFFLRPGPESWTLDDYYQYSWSLLQYLHEHDPEPWPDRVPRDPDDPAWSFCFGGLPLFINFHTPVHTRRRSRGMRAAYTLLIQPRDGFDILAGDHPKGRHARQLIRDRLVVYDGVPAHPALGHYGSGDNREWKQYFLSDDDDVPSGACPFHPKSA